MMHGHEKSDSAIVAGKPTNKAVSTAAEPVERRVEAKGNARQQSTRRTQSRVSVLQALERIRQAVTKTLCRHTPKVGAVCPNWARTDLCGGRSVMSVPTAISEMSVFCNLGRTPWVYRAFSYQRLFADAEKGPMQIAPGQSDICEFESY